jgi:hypothetical protein
MKRKLQLALDKGLVAAAVKADADATHLNRYLSSNLGPVVSGVTAGITTSTNANGDTVYASNANFAVRTYFLRMIGVNSVNVTATAEATLASQIVTATFSPIGAKGAFAKDIFLFTRDAAGNVTYKQTALNYRYGVSGSGTSPAIGSWTVSFTVPKYSTFGLGMVAYEDLSYQGALTSPKEYYSDKNAANFIATGQCSDPAGAQYNVEDGGDNDFADFVYSMKCTKGVVPNSVARISR